MPPAMCGAPGVLQPLSGVPLPPLNGVLALPEGALLALSIHGVRRLEAKPANSGSTK